MFEVRPWEILLSRGKYYFLLCLSWMMHWWEDFQGCDVEIAVERWSVFWSKPGLGRSLFCLWQMCPPKPRSKGIVAMHFPTQEEQSTFPLPHHPHSKPSKIPSGVGQVMSWILRLFSARNCPWTLKMMFLYHCTCLLIVSDHHMFFSCLRLS